MCDSYQDDGHIGSLRSPLRADTDRIGRYRGLRRADDARPFPSECRRRGGRHLPSGQVTDNTWQLDRYNINVCDMQLFFRSSLVFGDVMKLAQKVHSSITTHFCLVLMKLDLWVDVDILLCQNLSPAELLIHMIFSVKFAKSIFKMYLLDVNRELVLWQVTI